MKLMQYRPETNEMCARTGPNGRRNEYFLERVLTRLGRAGWAANIALDVCASMCRGTGKLAIFH